MIRTVILLVLATSATWAAQTKYCPQNQGYIQIGMTEDQVLSACGQPMMKQTTNIQVSRRIPVTQLIYTNLNQGGVFMGYDRIYSMWSLPSGSLGVSMQIDVVDGKVKSMNINGSGTNASSLCNGVGIQAGDPLGRVYSACGNPSLINESFIDEPVPSSAKPAKWTYQIDPYQPQFSLTFVNGLLQSID